MNCKGTVPTAPNLKNFQSLKLCYLDLYHRKSGLSFSLHLKDICTRECVFRNVYTICNNHDTNSIAIDYNPTC